MRDPESTSCLGRNYIYDSQVPAEVIRDELQCRQGIAVGQVG